MREKDNGGGVLRAESVRAGGGSFGSGGVIFTGEEKGEKGGGRERCHGFCRARPLKLQNSCLREHTAVRTLVMTAWSTL